MASAAWNAYLNASQEKTEWFPQITMTRYQHCQHASQTWEQKKRSLKEVYFWIVEKLSQPNVRWKWDRGIFGPQCWQLLIPDSEFLLLSLKLYATKCSDMACATNYKN